MYHSVMLIRILRYNDRQLSGVEDLMWKKLIVGSDVIIAGINFIDGVLTT